jgi:hypothetical protein
MRFSFRLVPCFHRGRLAQLVEQLIAEPLDVAAWP